MKRYQLPDVLGGGVIEADEIWGGCAGGWPEYRLAGGFTVLAPKGEPFGEVAPPLPPEPDNGTVVLCCGEAAMRFEDNDLAEDPAAHWASVGTTQRWTWAQMVEINGGPPRLLVPAAAPVDLPWHDGPLSVAFNPHGLGVGGPHKVVVEVGGHKVHVVVARAAGRALWAAADATEAL